VTSQSPKSDILEISQFRQCRISYHYHNMEAIMRNPNNRRWAMIAGGALAVAAFVYYTGKDKKEPANSSTSYVGSKSNAMSDKVKDSHSSQSKAGAR